MSNRSKRTTVVANAEPPFVQSCLTKWSKGLERGARWDKVSTENLFLLYNSFPIRGGPQLTTVAVVCYASLLPDSFTWWLCIHHTWSLGYTVGGIVLT